METDKTADGIESWDQFAILDNMPIAFCIIVLVIGEMVNRSFFDVFENGDKKWLVAYADVAVNGVSRIIEGYSPEVDADLKIYCFQPKPNFCACALIKQEDIRSV